MGTTTSKKADNTGEIINNLTIEDTVSVENKEVLWLLIAILTVLILSEVFKLYMKHRRGLRKRYLASPARVAVVDGSHV